MERNQGAMHPITEMWISTWEEEEEEEAAATSTTLAVSTVKNLTVRKPLFLPLSDSHSPDYRNLISLPLFESAHGFSRSIMANFLAQFQSIKTSSGHLVVAGIFYFFPILKAAFLHSTDLYSAWLNWKCYSAFSVFELFYVIIHELKEDYSVVALLVSNLWAFKITFFSGYLSLWGFAMYIEVIR